MRNLFFLIIVMLKMILTSCSNKMLKTLRAFKGPLVTRKTRMKRCAIQYWRILANFAKNCVDTSLANWTKVSCGCSSRFADAKFLGSTPIDGIVVLSHSALDNCQSVFAHRQSRWQVSAQGWNPNSWKSTKSTLRVQLTSKMLWTFCSFFQSCPVIESLNCRQRKG